ncbi:MAG: DUF86 domain-containing protein [Leptolyngbya sp. Prado105]|jgi:uncharacterized protein YutE (UPF0331/DUF86 family)|nr:DUF86 domain-containing protein [Leptolyngbya sp. Prado105]
MTFDLNSIEVRLDLIAGYLTELSQLTAFTSDEILADFYKYRTTERLLELIIQASLDINRHLLKEIRQIEPTTNADAFTEAIRVGILPEALGSRLVKAAGLRNRLAHRYEQIDPEIVIEAIQPTLTDYPTYIRAINAYLDSLEVDDDAESQERE